MVADAVELASRKKREELLYTKEKGSDVFKGITAALDYTPLTPEIKRIIYRRWHIVKEIPGCSATPRIGLRKTKSIKDLVTKSNIIVIQKTPPHH